MFSGAGVPEPVRRALAGLPRPVCAYVYDRSVLRDTAGRVRAALPAGATLLYAVKANGHPAVVGTLAGCVDGLEVASGGELAAAVAAGARRVVFGGPGKTDAELAAAVAAGALLNVESVHELRRLAAVLAEVGGTASGTVGATAGGTAGGTVGATRGGPVPVALRVNRAARGPDGSHRMTGAATPFGIDEAGLPAALALAGELAGLRVVGFHLHAVSNNLDAAAHARFVVDALGWARATAGEHRMALEYVNVGGGFGVDYTGDGGFDLGLLRDGLAAVDRVDAGRLVFEPGRYLAAGAGWYAAEVLDLKRTHGRWFAVLRGGTHHFRLPAAWGYSHPFTVLPVAHWPYRFTRPEVRDVAVDVVGELCTTRDVLARDAPVVRLRVGDVLVFAKTGAYGWDISHRDFLRHPYPEMVVL